MAGTAAGFSHPLNPNSELVGARMSAMAGLSRAGVSWVRVPAGKESFVYHSHEREWIYVLPGRGVAEVGGEEHEVGPGDFMGFPTPSPITCATRSTRTSSAARPWT